VIGVGIIGMGFMGWRHAESYAWASKRGAVCEVVAVFDHDRARCDAPATEGNISGSGERARPTWRVCESVDELLADPRVSLVSVCTPTLTHVDIARRALEAGKHVLVEKPVGLSADVVRGLVDAARRADTLCVPAHCMRFWPGWDWLRDAIANGEFGRIRSATFMRGGALPRWSSAYGDVVKSGGVLVDFHIHDADFVLWALGTPRAVCSTGNDMHFTTMYRFDGAGPAHVTAEAGWTRSAASGFRMRYTVAFERATAEFEMDRDPALLLSEDAGSRAIELPEGTGYDRQIEHVVRAIGEGRRDVRVTMDDALAVAALLDAERESLRLGAWVELR
jgi:predicted dehydrogenase